MYSTAIVNQILILFLLMAVGFGLQKKVLISDETVLGLSNILINIALPALIIVSFNQKFSRDMVYEVGKILLFSTLIHLLLMMLARLPFKRYEHNIQNNLKFMTIFPNIGFMGFPVLIAIFGQESIFYGAIFMVPYQILMWTYGQSLFAGDQNTHLIKMILNNPPIIATLIGFWLFLLSVQLPFPLHQTIAMLGNLTTPLSMLIIGYKIAQSSLRDILFDRQVYAGVFIRLIIAPVLTFFILKGIGTAPLLIGICTTIEAMPVAASGAVLAEKFGGDAIFASKCSLITTILSLVTIPLIVVLLL